MAVTTEILRSWTRPRKVMRGLLSAGQREDRAIMLLLAGCFVIFIAQWPRLARDVELNTAAGAETDQPLQMLIGGALFAWLFIMPVVFYGLAALSHLVMRAFGGRGGWYGARLALFWTVRVISPLMLLQGLTAGLVGPGPALILVQTIVAVGFFAHWTLCLREAEFGAGAGA